MAAHLLRDQAARAGAGPRGMPPSIIGIPPTYVELAVAPNDLLCGTTFQEA